MQELADSYCERCGTRYTFGPAPTKGPSLANARLLARGFKHFVMNDGSSIDEAIQAARIDTGHEDAVRMTEEFHKVFNFCMTCRQYACEKCWNENQGACLSCAPLWDTPAVAPQDRLIIRTPVARFGEGTEEAAPEPPAQRPARGRRKGAAEWPAADLIEPSAAAPQISEPLEPPRRQAPEKAAAAEGHELRTPSWVSQRDEAASQDLQSRSQSWKANDDGWGLWPSESAEAQSADDDIPFWATQRSTGLIGPAEVEPVETREPASRPKADVPPEPPARQAPAQATARAGKEPSAELALTPDELELVQTRLSARQRRAAPKQAEASAQPTSPTEPSAQPAQRTREAERPQISTPAVPRAAAPETPPARKVERAPATKPEPAQQAAPRSEPVRPAATRAVPTRPTAKAQPAPPAHSDFDLIGSLREPVHLESPQEPEPAGEHRAPIIGRLIGRRAPAEPDHAESKPTRPTPKRGRAAARPDPSLPDGEAWPHPTPWSERPMESHDWWSDGAAQAVESQVAFEEVAAVEPEPIVQAELERSVRLESEVTAAEVAGPGPAAAEVAGPGPAAAEVAGPGPAAAEVAGPGPAAAEPLAASSDLIGGSSPAPAEPAGPHQDELFTLPPATTDRWPMAKPDFPAPGPVEWPTNDLPDWAAAAKLRSGQLGPARSSPRQMSSGGRPTPPPMTARRSSSPDAAESPLVAALWEESTQPIMDRGNVRVCHSCALPVSTHARFCRRCGAQQD